MTTKIRAIGFRSHGGPEVLEELDLELPAAPPAGTVRIRVLAVALNHLDLWVRRGLPSLKLPLPHRLGSDIAGEIVALGDGAVAPPPGTRVVLAPGTSCGVCEACLGGRDNFCRRYHILGESTHGGYGDVLDVPAANLLPWPGTLSPVEAAAIPLTFQTAWQMVVERAALRAGETMLVHAAGAGVSVAAIQIGKMLGARVIVTSTKEEKLARAKELGADEGILSTAQDFVAECRRLTGKAGVDVVVEHLGGEVFEKSLLALRNGGRLVTCGATAGPRPTVDLRHVFFRQLSVLGSTMGSKAALYPVLRAVEQGKLRPVVAEVFPMTADGARAAHTRLEAGTAFGKLVLAH